METDEADYTKFSEGMATRRRQAADEAAPPPTRSIVVGQSSSSVEPPPTESLAAITFSNRVNQPAPSQQSPAAAPAVPEFSHRASKQSLPSPSVVEAVTARSKEASPAKP